MLTEQFLCCHHCNDVAPRSHRPSPENLKPLQIVMTNLNAKSYILTLEESSKCLIALATLGDGNPMEAICFTVLKSLVLKLAVGSGSVYRSGLATVAVAVAVAAVVVVVAVVVLVCGLGGSEGGGCVEMAAS